MGGVASDCFKSKETESQANVPSGKSITFGYSKGFRSEYRLGKELGRGQFGVTYMCTKVGTDEQLAAKVIQKSTLGHKQAFDDVVREVKILRTLQGQRHVVQMQAAFESATEVILVLELCTGGELFARLLKTGKYAEQDAADIMRQVLTVIADCHLNGVIHRDLKPENFLFAHPGEDAPLKLIDFGLSEFFTMNTVFKDVAGSAFYVAPEVLRKSYGPAADLWSAGVIMFILLTGEVPFWGPTEPDIFKKVLTGTLDMKDGACGKVSRPAKELLLLLLNRDPESRISAAKALAHPWIAAPGVASAVPLDIAVIANMDRFASYNKVKQKILLHLANTFSASELQHLRAQFVAMDLDGSGTITIQEMRQAITTFKTGENNSAVHNEDDINRMMATIDVDGDGKIDYMEFVAATMSTYQMATGVTKESHAAWNSRIKFVFDSIDEDGNGQIDAQELEKLMGNTPEIATLIKEADKDGDGLIDYEEFKEMLRDSAKQRAPRTSRKGATSRG